MSTEIKEMKELINPHAAISDANLKMFYPKTHMKAVVDDEGNTLVNALESFHEEVIGEASDMIAEAQRDINIAISEYAPVEITGDVTNAADEEDLTSVSIGGTDVIRLKDKTYAPLLYSGLGKKYMRKNLVGGVNLLTQEMMPVETGGNTIYYIQYDYDLDGETITVPEGCVLEFEGGSLRNGTLNGNCSIISCIDNSKIFEGIIFTGSFNNSWNVCWFGAKGDFHKGASNIPTDNTTFIQDAFNSINLLDGTLPTDGYARSHPSLYFPAGKYFVAGQISIPSKTSMYGDDSNDAAIICDYDGIVFYYHPDSRGALTLDVHDLSFEGIEHNTKNTRVFSNLRTSEVRTWMARWRFSRCKFVWLYLPIDLEIAYYGRMTDCDFTRNYYGDVRITNPNSTSIINCNFMGGMPQKQFCVNLASSFDKYGVCGSNIVGCNFDEGGIPIVVEDHVVGLNISGNYFEPYNSYSYNGTEIETWVKPVMHFTNTISPTSITGLTFIGNGLYEKYTGWTSRPTEPLRYILFEASRIINSHIDCDICVKPNTNGYGNFGIVRCHPYEELVSNLNDTLTLERELWNMEKTEEGYADKFNELSQLILEGEELMDTDDTSPLESLFSIYIDRKTGKNNFEKKANEMYISLGATFDSATGKYSMYGVDNLSDSDMAEIYRRCAGRLLSDDMSNLFKGMGIKTISRFIGLGGYLSPSSAESMFEGCNAIRGLDFGYRFQPKVNVNKCFKGCYNLRFINPGIGLGNIPSMTEMFDGCVNLRDVNIYTLASDISFKDSKYLSKDSVLFMITNSAGNRTIQITLHSDVYNRLINDADIIAALANRPGISIIIAS